MVGDERQRRAVGTDRVEVRHELLSAGDVEAGGRLVEQQQLRVGHEGSGQLHPLPLTARQGPEAVCCQSGDAETVERRHGTGAVVVGVLVPPRLE